MTISLRQLEEISKEISLRGKVSGLNEVVWALKALTLTDLTTLAGDDTEANVRRLCHRAAYPFPLHLLENCVEPSLLKQIHTGAVCVYPARVADAQRCFEQLKANVPIAAVATGFPTGQYGLKTRLEEITFAIESGAKEIDIVINRQLALTGQWKKLYDEVCEMRKACGDKAHLKTILAIGELGSMENVSAYAIIHIFSIFFINSEYISASNLRTFRFRNRKAQDMSQRRGIAYKIHRNLHSSY